MCINSEMSYSLETFTSFSGAAMSGMNELRRHSDISIGQSMGLSFSQQEISTVSQQGISHRSMENNGVSDMSPTRRIEIMDVNCFCTVEFTSDSE